MSWHQAARLECEYHIERGKEGERCEPEPGLEDTHTFSKNRVILKITQKAGGHPVCNQEHLWHTGSLPFYDRNVSCVSDALSGLLAVQQ